MEVNLTTYIFYTTSCVMIMPGSNGSIYSFHHHPLDESMGSGVRIINILKIMSRIFDSTITHYTLSNDGLERNVDGIIEKHIRKPFPFATIKAGYLCMFPFTIAGSLRSELLPSLRECSIMIFETPFMGYAVSKTLGISNNTLKIYDAHNVEVRYWRPDFTGPLKKRLLRRIKVVEQYIVDFVDYIFVTSSEEARIFRDEYSALTEKMVLVPNGVDTNSLKPLNEEVREAERSSRLDLGYSKYIVFMGSNVKANADAAEWIVNYLAPRLPHICFMIIGSVCRVLENSKCPTNVKLLGVLPIKEKNLLLGLADGAINPVVIGAGTNIKMLEYLAAGLPIITTDVGGRGLDLINDHNSILCEIEKIEENILELFSNDSLRLTLAKNARIKAQEFDWKTIENNIKVRLRV
jgi:glycosyltransferase involved in cell wall biosynthesis